MDKVALVRLRALNDHYDRAMDASKKKTDALTKSSTNFDALGKKMTDVGSTLTRNVTLPLIAVGGVAAKMSVDFDRVFGQMQGLAGVAADEIDGLKSKVLSLAGETGKAPQELAEALYFIRSAGIDGQDALDALEVSAKGAAAGLGDAAAIADAVTSAMNAYGPSVVSAAEATDVLVATAREGKAEAAALAPQFGRLLPVAAELGIRFDEVGAGLAFLSRSSGSAELSATQLSGVMAKLLKPSMQGAEALEAVGLSADGIRQSIEQKGLLGTLQMLRERLGDTGFNKFFDDIQGLQGALILTGGQADEARQVFDSLADSTGALGEAFDAASSRDGFKMQQVLAELQAAMIQIGDVIAPLAADIASFVSVLTRLFTSLPGPMQQVIVLFGGLLAAVGPLMSIGGKLASNWGKLVSGFDKAAIGSYNAAGAVGRLGGALKILGFAGAIAGAVQLARSTDHATVNVDALAAATANLSDAQREQVEEVLLIAQKWGQLDEVVGKTADGNVKAAERLLDLAESAGITGDELERLRGIVDAKREADVQASVDQAAYADEVQGAGEAAAGATGGVDGLTGGLEDNADAAEEARNKFEELLNTYRAAVDPLFGMLDALDGNREAQDALAEAIAKNNDNTKDNNVSAEEMNALYRDVAKSALDVEVASRDLAFAVQNGTVSFDQGKAMLAEWVAQGLITEEQAGNIAYQFGVAAGKADEFAGDYTANLNAQDDASPVIDALVQKALTAAAQIAGTIFHFQGTATVRPTASPGRYGATGGPVPDGLSTVYRAVGGPIGTDTVNAWLSPGEFVMQKSAVDQFGVGFMHAMNQGRLVAGAGSRSSLTIEIPVMLDGRRIGSARSVIEGIDSARAVRDRNTAGAL